MCNVFVVVPSMQQPLTASVSGPSSLHHTQPSFSTTSSHMSSTRPLSSSPLAVPLIEHLRRLKHGTPTSPLLAAATLPASTSAEAFQTSHDVGLKDLLLSNDEDMMSAKAGAATETEKLTPFIHQSPAMSPSPLVALNGLADAHMFDATGRQSRPAVILKQLLEDRSDPASCSPTVTEAFDASPKSQGPSDMMFRYDSSASVPGVSESSSLTPTSQVQPPFVQLITSVDDGKQSSPTAPLTFSVAELTSVSHLWSPPSFTSQLNCVSQVPGPSSTPGASSLPQTQTSVALVKTGVQSLMSMASSQSVTLTSTGGLQLKVAPPRMSASRNVLLRVSFLLICLLRLYIAVAFLYLISSSQNASNMQTLCYFLQCS